MVEVPNSTDRPPVALPPPAASTATMLGLPPGPPADPQAEFDHHYLAFEDWVAYNIRTGVVVNTWSKPVEGKYRKPLSYGDFYDRVGRSDLADRYRTRRNLKIGFAVGGGVGIIAGLGALIGQFRSNSQSFDSCVLGHVGGDCNLESGNGGYVAGGILIGAGTIAIISAFAVPLQPAQPYEAREMADQYNTKLRNQLQLDAAPSAPASGPNVSLAPSVSSTGAGLRLTARF
jgi:hypothetical protein